MGKGNHSGFVLLLFFVCFLGIFLWGFDLLVVVVFLGGRGFGGGGGGLVFVFFFLPSLEEILTPLL